MSKITNNWATVRLVIYSGIAVVCGGLVLAGVITEDQSHTYLGYIGSGLGALGVILASVNINKTPPPVPPEQVPLTPSDVPDITDAIAARLNYGVRQAQSQTSATVAELRARVEQELGYRLGG